MVEMLEVRAGENEIGSLYSPKHLSCLKEDLKDITTSQENVAQHLSHQRNETGELKELLTEEVELENEILTKANHNEITRLKELRKLLEYSIEEIDNPIMSCLQTRSSFQTNIKLYTINHDCPLITRVVVNHNLTDVKDYLNSSQYGKGHMKKSNRTYLIAKEDKESQQMRKMEMILVSAGY